MTIIAPSVLAADFSRIKEQLDLIKKAGAQWVHVDVMDGHFVPNLTFGPNIVRDIRNMTDLYIDVHLMVEEPDFIIPAFRKAGADNITVQVEAIKHLHRTIQYIKESGADAGVALNPATPASSLEMIISDIDLVLAMTVNPGYGGQSFISEVLPKISAIVQMAEQKNKSLHIEVDGGINTTTAPLVIDAGANVLVAGTAVFGETDIIEAVHKLKMADDK